MRRCTLFDWNWRRRNSTWNLDYSSGLLYPPVRFAYDHPDRTGLPPEALRPRDKIDEAYAREEELLRWLITEYFPANPGSRFVSSADLKTMTADSNSEVSMALLKKAASVLVSEWGANSVPPSYVTVEDHHFSLANMFQMLASTLSSIGQTGKAPNVVPLLHVYGPDEIVDEAGCGPSSRTLGYPTSSPPARWTCHDRRRDK